ncbi:hypothetical protein DCG74_00120 [Bradyrhizobium sp. WBAH42]|nr:hypothetical protein [Bradyrhizobium sp. WBAH30]MDD1546182.1 hypothetical protein [Bradyrhizobium sp. WBAH41]MDD1560062.1 hypothetical protein [Bradyrhizobium sp. WBAH23]MDD1567164.1 hypothetical protein [Bradyrhizobium sp. WBAH33]MDD1593472.1 hypothetical protein [Bradyrhizobium sp. WBAH42]NRB90673.1 hypothetical protein [Bradyrhizobium sp. WBAH10]QCJ87105.1 hypothetical protein DAA57_00130 [Bradyrhizobium yuanmingense]
MRPRRPTRKGINIAVDCPPVRRRRARGTPPPGRSHRKHAARQLRRGHASRRLIPAQRQAYQDTSA